MRKASIFYRFLTRRKLTFRLRAHRRHSARNLRDGLFLLVRPCAKSNWRWRIGERSVRAEERRWQCHPGKCRHSALRSARGGDLKLGFGACRLAKPQAGGGA